MNNVGWRNHYKTKFGLRWYLTDMLHRIADLNVLANFNTILGVGSGRAFTENLLSRSKDRFVIASDVNAELLHIAKEHSKSTKYFLVCDSFKLPFISQSFECVYSQGLLEHFNNSEAIKLLREMSRVGENVVFSVPLSTYKGKSFGIEHRREPKEWMEILSNLFQFRKQIIYYNKREAVFIASNKPLANTKRIGTIDVFGRILVSTYFKPQKSQLRLLREQSTRRLH